jgi:hypothetical protein
MIETIDSPKAVPDPSFIATRRSCDGCRCAISAERDQIFLDATEELVR